MSPVLKANHGEIVTLPRPFYFILFFVNSKKDNLAGTNACGYKWATISEQNEARVKKNKQQQQQQTKIKTPTKTYTEYTYTTFKNRERDWPGKAGTSKEQVPPSLWVFPDQVRNAARQKLWFFICSLRNR